MVQVPSHPVDRGCELLRRQLARGLPALLRLLASHLLIGSGDGGVPFGWAARAFCRSCMHSCCSAAASVRACQHRIQSVEKLTMFNFETSLLSPSTEQGSSTHLMTAQRCLDQFCWLSGLRKKSYYGSLPRHQIPGAATLRELQGCSGWRGMFLLQPSGLQ